jgi:Acetyltransferase (GNAT) domain
VSADQRGRARRGDGDGAANGIQARLGEDRGAAAAAPGEFFRCPQFLAAEGVTHTLQVDGPDSSLAVPLIVRAIPGSELRDAISPYGYPGATWLELSGGAPRQAPTASGPATAGSPAVGEPPLDPAAVDWSGTGLVSIFIRDRIDATPCFSAGTERNPVQIADPALPSGIRKRLREQIRRAARQGWETSALPGRESGAEQRAAFRRAYDETMVRTAAAGRYRFDRDYFDAVLGASTSWLVLARRDGDDQPAAGAIAVLSDGLLHYFLGGTAQSALAASPMKSVFAAMIELAGELRVPLHLGGGITPGDSLEEFKRGFANRSARMITHEIVCDEAVYRELARAAAGEPGFFPAYRG